MLNSSYKEVNKNYQMLSKMFWRKPLAHLIKEKCDQSMSLLILGVSGLLKCLEKQVFREVSINGCLSVGVFFQSVLKALWKTVGLVYI